MRLAAVTYNINSQFNLKTNRPPHIIRTRNAIVWGNRVLSCRLKEKATALYENQAVGRLKGTWDIIKLSRIKRNRNRV